MTIAGTNAMRSATCAHCLNEIVFRCNGSQLWWEHVDGLPWCRKNSPPEPLEVPA